MLQPLKHIIASQRIVLASGSPRRQELVQNMVRFRIGPGVSLPDLFHLQHLQGLNAELCPSLFEENLKAEDFPTFEGFVEATALGKVLEVYDRLSGPGEPRPPDVVIGADTVVTLDGKIYGKPKTNEVAFDMLKK